MPDALDALSAPQSVPDSRPTTDAREAASGHHSGGTEANRGKAAPTEEGRE